MVIIIISIIILLILLVFTLSCNDRLADRNELLEFKLSLRELEICLLRNTLKELEKPKSKKKKEK